MRRTLLVAAAAAACACGGERSVPGPAPASASVSVAATSALSPARIAFTDVSESSGLTAFTHVSGGAEKLHLLESVGGGVAWLDYDGDGDLDAYLTNGSAFGNDGTGARDALFRNDAGRFTDVSAETGVGDAAWTLGVTVADYDEDGRPDVYLTNYGPDVLLHNEGGRFRDVTKAAGLGEASWSTGAAFFDLEGDGDLDLYVAAYMDYRPGDKPASTEYCEYRGVMVSYGPRGMKGARDRLYEQVSPGRFRDVTEAQRIDEGLAYGFQVLAFDADDDGDTDVFVANDSVANYLWINEGGRLTDKAMRQGVALRASGDAQACMGATLGDPTGDGRIDLLVTNFSEDYNTLYRGEGRGFFIDATHAARLAEPALAFLGWGCAFLDAELDGDQDLVVANGHVYPQVDRFDFGFSYRQACQVFENLGGGRFEDATARAGPALAAERSHRGLATGDYDEDGDEDLLIGVIDGAPVLLRNDSPRSGHWLAIALRDDRGLRDGTGARVVVRTPAGAQAHAALTGSSFCSSSDPRLRFGLGDAASAQVVEVYWPGDPAPELFRDVAGDRVATLQRGTGAPD
jgi:enediyne biosynthesis protein E4